MTLQYLSKINNKWDEKNLFFSSFYCCHCKENLEECKKEEFEMFQINEDLWITAHLKCIPDFKKEIEKEAYKFSSDYNLLDDMSEEVKEIFFNRAKSNLYPWKEGLKPLINEFNLNSIGHIPVIRFPVETLPLALDPPFKDYYPPFNELIIKSFEDAFFVKFKKDPHDHNVEHCEKCNKDIGGLFFISCISKEHVVPSPITIRKGMSYLKECKIQKNVVWTVYKDGSIGDESQIINNNPFIPHIFPNDHWPQIARRFIYLFNLINCRNVKLVPAESGKIKNKDGNNIGIEYHEVKINKHIVSHIPSGNKTDITYRQHWCRGHFKNRKSGRYWWAPHIRGSLDKGKIIKNYNAEKIIGDSK